MSEVRIKWGHYVTQRQVLSTRVWRS